MDQQIPERLKGREERGAGGGVTMKSWRTRAPETTRGLGPRRPPAPYCDLFSVSFSLVSARLWAPGPGGAPGGLRSAGSRANAALTSPSKGQESRQWAEPVWNT